MSRKRCFGDHDQVGEVFADCSNTYDQHMGSSSSRGQQKRCCGTARNPAPGEMTADEVATYLHSLSSHLDNSQVEHASQVLNAAGWKALAELNILMGSGALPDGSLHSYSCFTRQPRARLWLHYSKYAAGRANLSPQQLELLRFLLEWVLALFPDCALTEVTLDLPPGMVSWASRWGMASSRIKVFRLEAYAAVDPFSSSGLSAVNQQPAQVIYVPALL